MIQLEKINKKIKGNRVLNNISYTFEKGKVYGLYGINGSGKTMMLRAISGLLRMDSGKVIIDGETLGETISFSPNT